MDVVKIFGPLSRFVADRYYEKKSLIKIKELRNDLNSFDVLIIGTPVWASDMCIPIKLFIEKYKDQFPEVAFFCTCNGSNGSTFENMGKICGKSPIATMELTGGDFAENVNDQKIEQFVIDIQSWKKQGLKFYIS
jgi:multimeric flavodoxin WrbA